MKVATGVGLDDLLARIAELHQSVREALDQGDMAGALTAESERGELIRSLFDTGYGLDPDELQTLAGGLLRVQEALDDAARTARRRLEQQMSRVRRGHRGAGAYLAADALEP